MQAAGKTKPSQSNALFEGLEGVLLGTAVGDALGLPAENMSPARIRRWWNGRWQMRFLPRRGMISDDTEHTLMVAQALMTSMDATTFQRALAWKLRWWFASLPGGVGMATARACLKLWLGFPVSSGAVSSAGSGPAMRSAIIGAFFAEDLPRRREFVLASSRLTHKGWEAETAALAVAEATALAIQQTGMPDRAQVMTALAELSSASEWSEVIARMTDALERNCSVSDFVHHLGLNQGVSGYSLHVVPVALFAWLRHEGEFRVALISALDCGGDTDTVGAILGALCGASHGRAGIPAEWIEHIFEWPRSVGYMRSVAAALADRTSIDGPRRQVWLFWPGIVPRNIFFLSVVLLHGLRRLLPPY